MVITRKNPVLETPPAPSDVALKHFSERLGFETDCWDVHASSSLDEPGFVLLDVRSREAFEGGHVPGATHLPWARIDRTTLARYPDDTPFVVYCSGPHCNGANRAAVRLASLGRPVKLMIGGVTGWLDEGFELVRD